MAHRVVMAAPKRFSVKGPPAKQVLASKDPLTTSRLEAWPGTAGSGGLGMLELRPKTGAARPHEETGRSSGRGHGRDRHNRADAP